MKSCLQRSSERGLGLRSVILLAGLALGFCPPALGGQGSGPPPVGAAKTNSTPIVLWPSPSSASQTPIDEFIMMLAQPPAERVRLLASRPEPKRRVLLAKLEEYSALPKAEREVRLEVLQLRWYLEPLMAIPAASRAAQLAAIPPNYRKLVEARLAEWDILLPQLQKEVLENETTRRYFIRWQSSKPGERRQMLEELPPSGRQDLETRLAQWQALSPSEREKISAKFNRYFELTEDEQRKTLGILTTTERKEMEQVLATFQKLPPAQRQGCIDSFLKFASLSPSEREEFLRNVDRWREISASERQAWRDLVNALPPLPPGLVPATTAPPPMPGPGE